MNLSSFCKVDSPVSLLRNKYRYTLLSSSRKTSAFFASSLIRDDNVLKQLNRKCGLTWLFSTSNSCCSDIWDNNSFSAILSLVLSIIYKASHSVEKTRFTAKPTNNPFQRSFVVKV